MLLHDILIPCGVIVMCVALFYGLKRYYYETTSAVLPQQKAGRLHRAEYSKAITILGMVLRVLSVFMVATGGSLLLFALDFNLDPTATFYDDFDLEAAITFAVLCLPVLYGVFVLIYVNKTIYGYHASQVKTLERWRAVVMLLSVVFIVAVFYIGSSFSNDPLQAALMSVPLLLQPILVVIYVLKAKLV